MTEAVLEKPKVDFLPTPDGEMSVSIAQKDLATALDRAAVGAAGAQGYKLARLSAWDHFVGIVGSSPGARVETKAAATVTCEGTICVDFAFTQKIIKRLPAQDLSLIHTGSSLVVRCGKTTIKIPAIAASEFPMLSPIDHEDAAISLRMPCKTLWETVEAVAHAASDDKKAEPHFSAVDLAYVWFGADDEKRVLRFAATDRYGFAIAYPEVDLLALGIEAHDEDCDHVSAMVFAETLRALRGVMDASATGDATVSIIGTEGVADGHQRNIVVIETGDTKASLRSLDGEYVHIGAVLDHEKKHTDTITVSNKELQACLQMTVLVTESKTFNRTNFDIQEREGGYILVINAEENLTGAVTMEIPCAAVRPASFIASSQIMMGALTHLPDGDVTIGFEQDQPTAIVVRSPRAGSVVQAMMPLVRRGEAKTDEETDDDDA